MEKDTLEQAFRADWLQSSILQIRFSILLIGVITLFYLVMDPQIMSPEHFAIVKAWRLYVHLPLVALVMISTIAGRDELIFPAATWGMVGGSLAFTHYTYISGLETLVYGTVAQVHVLVTIFVLLRTPFRLALICGFAVVLPFVLAVLSWGASMPLAINAIVSLLITVFMLALGTYQRDIKARELFISQNKIYVIQQERDAWLKNFTRFIKHEVGNQLVGVSTSVELISRNQGDQTKYLDRARDSLDRMRQLFNGAVEATNLEASLKEEESSEVDLSIIVRERVEAFQDTYPDTTISFEEDSKAKTIIGNELRLIQMIDNLLNNAIHHGSPHESIKVSLREAKPGIRLEIENGGKRLPTDIAKLFQPGFSDPDSSKHGVQHFGLGLYIAKAVADAHNASIGATNRDAVGGAIFGVTFPDPDES